MATNIVEVPMAVTVKLDRERRLIFDLNAMVAIEEATGRNLLDANSWDKKKGLLVTLDTRTFLRVLCAMLRTDDPEITEAKLGSIVKPSEISAILPLISKAIVESMGEDRPT